MPSAYFINKFLPSVLPITQVQNSMMASLTALLLLHTMLNLWKNSPCFSSRSIWSLNSLTSILSLCTLPANNTSVSLQKSCRGICFAPSSPRVCLFDFCCCLSFFGHTRQCSGWLLALCWELWQYSEDHIWCLALDLGLLCARPVVSLLCHLSGKRFVPKLQSVTCLKPKPDNVLVGVLKWSWALTTPFTYYYSVPHSFCVHQDYFVFWPLFPDFSSWFLALLAWLPFRSAQMKSWEDHCTDNLKPKSILLLITYCIFCSITYIWP